MLPQSEVDNRTFTYQGMGLVWVKGEWIGKDQNDTSKPFPNTLFQNVKELPVDCTPKTKPLHNTIAELNHDLKLVKGLLEDETEAYDLLEQKKEKLQKQIDNHKCKVTELTAWEHLRLFFKKLLSKE